MSARRSCAHCGRIVEIAGEFCMACEDAAGGACPRCKEPLALETLCFLRRNRRVEWADPMMRAHARSVTEFALQVALLRTLAMRLRFGGAVGFVEATDGLEPLPVGTDMSPYPEFHASNETLLRVIEHSTGMRRIGADSTERSAE